MKKYGIDFRYDRTLFSERGNKKDNYFTPQKSQKKLHLLLGFVRTKTY